MRNELSWGFERCPRGKRDSPKSWLGTRIGKENSVQDRNGRSSRIRDCREKGAGMSDQDSLSRSCQVARAVH